MTDPSYLSIAQHYEQCFTTHGPGHLGVDWPNAEDADLRYRTMLGVIRETEQTVSLLDFGCGSGGLLEYLDRVPSTDVYLDYHGHDISPAYIDHCRRTYPHLPFTAGDVLTGAELPAVEYAIANGVFTEKLELSTDAMFDFLCDVVRVLFTSVRVGLAFNVMSKKVDWERDDLFHLDPERLEEFLIGELGADVKIIEDYGLYEYTAYVYKQQVA